MCYLVFNVKLIGFVNGVFINLVKLKLNVCFIWFIEFGENVRGVLGLSEGFIVFDSV